MYLLCIDTGTDSCSVAICNYNNVLAERNSARDFTHASLITIYIQECLSELGISLNHIAAVALSSGPGSYTGLRVGASVAKGICYAKDIPLIAIDSLTSLAYGVGQAHNGIIVPMIDARRMDAYVAIYDKDFNILEEMAKHTIDNDFIEKIKNQNTIAVGDATIKSAPFLAEAYINIGHVASKAQFMRIPAWAKFNQQGFENLDYFAPLYLNKPNITVNKKSLLK